MIYKSGLFCLCMWLARGVFGDEVKSVSVMEGDSVTLHTDITEIQRDDQILWMFGSKGSDTRIAQIYKQSISIYETSDKDFRNRLKLDSQTGSLTITNITITDSGLYKLQIITSKISYRNFNVTVYAHLPIPVISSNSSDCSSSSSSSKCVLLCSVLNVRDVSLSWYKENSLLSSISVSDLNISVSDLNIRLSLPLEVEYQDTNTYSCVVNNTITNQTQHLNISDLCQPCPGNKSISSSLQIGIIVGVVILVVAVAVAVFVALKYFCWKQNSRSTTNKDS
nr:uncharacterized protein LOC129453804 isoform X2 [Misgurnus anguillicaudatus]